ncbi:uncharacterized protein LOC111246516 [Varroa destructor]|uniref:PH domain-containing protein n=1 Tax=Varroa destructor TaxID=109461 RepID=A0A7M7MCH2_VARDE|nr:uncharacterized protein LOC111246516 [Varroa destructor]XP_022651981.1 uncharacterized protein LOC111246516 [Varroa destructor]XP_022651982.1 uncharacterized protein LOC111246516 [Varroa destructor]XP_022651983.1 uncharacterized protein LOC111246516 [Varroa destructor]
MDSMSILHAGWLQKMPHANHTFSKCRKRWFVLRSTKDDRYLLEYFNEPTSTKAKGSIDLSQCRGISPEGENGRRHFSFVLKTSERQYNLSTESFDDYKIWISRLAEAGGIPNPLPHVAKRTAPAPLKIVPSQESGGSLSSGPRTADSSGGKDKETSPYIPLLECRTGAKWTSADRTSPDPIMDDMRRIEMSNNLAARPPPPGGASGGQGQFNYDVPRSDLGTYSVPKPIASTVVTVGDTSAYSVPRPLPSDTQQGASATYAIPKSTPVPLDILTKSPPPANVNPPEIRTDHYLVPTNNAAVSSRLDASVLGTDALSYDVVPPPVTLVDAPPRPPKPPGMRGPFDGHSVCDEGAYDVPISQGGTAGPLDGGTGRIYGNAWDMAASAGPTSTTGGFLPDSTELINSVPPAVNRRLKPKPSHEPVTPPSATIASTVPRRINSTNTGSSGSPAPPPVPTRNNNGTINGGHGGGTNSSSIISGTPVGPQHFFPHDFRKPCSGAPGGGGASSSTAVDALLLADGDGHELQYLDLGNAEPSTPSPRTPGPHGSHHHGGHHLSSASSQQQQQQQQSQTCPSSSTAVQMQQSTAIEYKELDFVKTKALNETRQNVNKSYRAQLEEAH